MSGRPDEPQRFAKVHLSLQNHLGALRAPGVRALHALLLLGQAGFGSTPSLRQLGIACSSDTTAFGASVGEPHTSNTARADLAVQVGRSQAVRISGCLDAAKVQPTLSGTPPASGRGLAGPAPVPHGSSWEDQQHHGR